MSAPIKIHGRSSFRATVTYADEAGNPVDLTGKTIVFETSGAKFRKALTGGVLYLSRADVDALPTALTPFVIIDETIAGSETVMGEGMVQRVGWVAA